MRWCCGDLQQRCKRYRHHSGKGIQMGPQLILVLPCFRENVNVICKTVSFLSSLDDFLWKNVNVFYLILFYLFLEPIWNKSVFFYYLSQKWWFFEKKIPPLVFAKFSFKKFTHLYTFVHWLKSYVQYRIR